MKLSKVLKRPDMLFEAGLFYLFTRVKNNEGNRLVGVNASRSLAKKYYNLKYAKSRRARERRFNSEFEQLLVDNGVVNEQLVRNPIRMKDGWTIDKSRQLPYLTEILELGNQIFEARGPDTSRLVMPYAVAKGEELKEHDAFMNFALSSEMLAIAAQYLGCMPVLTNIDLLRSDPVIDRNQGELVGSQLFHLDIIDQAVVRVVILFSNITEQHGPFSFLPISVSNTVRKAKNLRYGKTLSSIDFADEQVYSVANRDDLIQVTGEPGTVLFVDTCNCFHYGSRVLNAERRVCMLTYTSSTKETFRDALNMDLKFGEVSQTDSELRRLVKHKTYY